MKIDVVDEQDDPLEPPIISAESIAELVGVVLTDQGFPESTEVGVTLVDEDSITALNHRHMGRDGPTDVLSFPIEDLAPGVVPDVPQEGMPVVIGDVVVCPGVVRRQAEAHGVAFVDEMALMVVHGVLHLLGYDHVVDAEAEHMERLEGAYLSSFGRVRP